jgi:type VI protein secretion system component VasK
MRKKFQSGVEAFQSRARISLASRYVIVGEPGSARPSHPALQRRIPARHAGRIPGVGGTRNCDWWFTDEAVLLDTEGRYTTQESEQKTDAAAWLGFLDLLKQYRPRRPLNGAIITVSLSDLLVWSDSDRARYADAVRQRIQELYTRLGIRFPLYVVVTKCDKINGFREFFDGLTDPQLQHQMMGWSNPDPLDEPFKPEKVDKHLDQVAVRLHRRRLGLLRRCRKTARGAAPTRSIPFTLCRTALNCSVHACGDISRRSSSPANGRPSRCSSAESIFRHPCAKALRWTPNLRRPLA